MDMLWIPLTSVAHVLNVSAPRLTNIMILDWILVKIVIVYVSLVMDPQ